MNEIIQGFRALRDYKIRDESNTVCATWAMRHWLLKMKALFPTNLSVPVSYTHLDVYKRQVLTLLDAFL